jgi:geranylgeranyl diphosphate synthase type II
MANAEVKTSQLANLLTTALEAHLNEYPHSNPELLEVAHYALRSRGHRWRPILFLRVSAQLDNRDLNRVLPIACAIEYLHTSSLLLDDLPCCDNARIRRGVPCAHIKFGEAHAIMASHWLCHVAQHQLHSISIEGETANLEEAFRATMNAMLKGQVADLRAGAAGLEDIIEEYRLKSGVLYGFAASAPALLLGEARAAEALREFGEFLGVAYQTADDIADITGSPQLLGKEINKDVGKSTLPRLIGVERAVKTKTEYRDRAAARLATLGTHEELLALADMIIGVESPITAE